MKTLRTILADDERVGRSRLRRMLEKEADIEVLAECGDGNAAVQAAREHAPDLLFLDINMPGLDGFGVLDALGPDGQPPAVIFVTAYDEHAVRAFEACALDYLLKPASPERLAKALARARGATRCDRGTGAKRSIIAGAGFTVRAASLHGAQRRADELCRAGGDRLGGSRGQLRDPPRGRQNHMIRETMSSMEEKLPAGVFLRVSRSAIANLRRVKELYAPPVGENSAILHDGQRVHITRPLREVAERLAAL